MTCPECDGKWDPGPVEKGEIISCPECGVELEITGVDPVEVGLAPQEEEDWGE